MDKINFTKLISSPKIWVYVILVIFLLITIRSSLVIVDAGYKAVILRYGSVAGVRDEGLGFKIPFIDRAIFFETRVRKQQILATAASKDLQQVDVTVALNYRTEEDMVDKIYQELGMQEDYVDRIIIPRLQEATKATTAKYTAEEIITKREIVRDELVNLIKQKLGTLFIRVEDVSIVNVEFSPEFTQAIEEKQLAEQRALKAENDLKRIEIEAKQKIVSAEAEAEALKIIKSNLSELVIKKMFIEKWDGKLPLVLGNQPTILDLSNLISEESDSNK